MSDTKPTRRQGDLAEMLDTLLDKGVVINADIAVSVGDTELLGIELRAAVASFETAAAYGLQFPAGTDMERVHQAADVEPLDGPEGEVLSAPERAAAAADEAAASDDGESTLDEGDGEPADGESAPSEDEEPIAEPTLAEDGEPIAEPTLGDDATTSTTDDT